MRRAIYTFIVFVAFGVVAATVRQESADDYYFTRPNLPSNIVGRVMGEPPAYHVMRSEDIAWLHEAYAERAALMGSFSYTTSGLPQIVTTRPQFGKWPLSYTNRFIRWTTATEQTQGGGIVTNVIVGYVVVTNKGSGVDSASIRTVSLWGDEPSFSNTNHNEYGYLTIDDAAYLSSARAWRLENLSLAEVTNVEQRTIPVPAWSNATSLITMTMTNGTVSVWTNSWSVFAPTNVTMAHTNVALRGVDIEHCIFTNRIVSGYGRAMPGPLRGLYDSKAITNHYGFLRGLRRLARRAGASGTQRLPIVILTSGEHHYHQSEYDSTYDYAVTNGTSVFPYCDVWCSQGESKEYVYVDDGWEIWESSSKGFEGRYASGTTTYELSSPSLAARPDGETLSIDSAKLFARVTVEYGEYDYAGPVDSDDPLAWYPDPYPSVSVNETNREWVCVLPLGDVDLSMNEHGKICFTINMGMDLLSRAWDVSGAPGSIPTSASYPSLRYTCPAPWRGEARPNLHGSTLDSKSQSSRWYKASVTHLLLLIDFAPRTSLPDW